MPIGVADVPVPAANRLRAKGVALKYHSCAWDRFTPIAASVPAVAAKSLGVDGAARPVAKRPLAHHLHGLAVTPR